MEIIFLGDTVSLKLTMHDIQQYTTSGLINKNKGDY
jgi:hypothetical protein